MKKIFKSLLVCLLLLSCSLFMVSCTIGDEAMSAYEIAVENGFVGTELQWLESLRGSDGQNSEITITDIYDQAVVEGFEGSFLDFIEQYLSDAKPLTIMQASNKAMLSVVSIFCDFESTDGQTYTSAGSGVIYQLNKTYGSAYIITNFHVVYEKDSNTSDKISDSIMVLLYGQEYEDYAIEATYLGGSMYYDIAVIKVQNSNVLKNSEAQAVEIADFYDLSLGQTTIALGNALGEGLSVTSGVLSKDSEYILMTASDGVTQTRYRVMRIDTAINGGNSGGGLFNCEGELIGIVNAKDVSDEVENVGFAIPASIAIGVAQNIIDNNSAKAKVPVIGITVEIAESESTYDSVSKKVKIVETLRIESVSSGSLAAEVLLQADDILQSVTIGETTFELTRLFHLTDILLNCRVGDTITLSILRQEGLNTVEKEIDLTFAAANITER